MKVLLTGSSGFIGRQTLIHLLDGPTITSVLILSRRPLPDLEALDPRVEVFVLLNFLEYPPSLIEKLADVDGCIWALGGSNSKPTPKEKCNEVEVQYPLTAAKALIAASKSRGREESIRFLFISGIASVRNQTRLLWVLEEERRARGLAETKLFELAEEDEGFETVIIKVGLVVGKEDVVKGWLLAMVGLGIRVDEMAAGMVDEVLNRRGKGSGTASNWEVRQRGRALMMSDKKLK